MANVNGWQTKFIQRCESVGWSVERTKSNHFKTYDGDGKFLFVFPTTPGDNRSMRNTESEANRHGLRELETRLALRQERDRLEKIRKDREASEAVEAEAALERIEADLKKIDKSTEHHPDLGTIDGIAIVMSGPVMFKSPLMKEPGPISGGEELLLADDRTVFRCLKPAATKYRPHVEGTCYKIYESVASLRTHIAYHSRVPARDDRSAATKQEDTSVPTSVPTSTPAQATHKRAEFDALDRALAQLQTSIKRIADTLPPLIIEVGTLRDAVRRLPAADQETLDKAAQFDALGAIFKNAAGK